MPRPIIIQQRDLQALGIIVPFLLRYKWQVALVFVCLLMITASTLVVPILMKEIVDAMSSPTQQVLAVPMAMLIAYGAVRFGGVIFREVRATVFGHVSVRAMRLLSRRVLTHLLSLDLEYHLSRRTGAISRDLDRGVDAVDSLPGS
jgi:ATP-binding cassette subfamily B protein